MDVAITGAGLVLDFVGRGETVRAVDHVDIEVPASALTAIAGPSGSGKSTLLSLLSCCQRPTAGTVQALGTDFVALSRGARRRFRGDHMEFLFPEPSESLYDDLPALGNVLLGTACSATDPQVGEITQSLGITPVLQRRIRQLSCGEQQRVALAGAVLRARPLLFADEPTSALDADSAARVIAALRRIAAERGTTVVVATHDHHLMDAADHLVQIRDGRVR